MDILALTSIFNSSSNLVYCHISVTKGLGELISSKYVNFSGGTNVIVDFYSSLDDHGSSTCLTKSPYELFNVSISGCIDYENHTYLQADPSSILYNALFHDLSDLLSDDTLPSLNFSSTFVALFQPRSIPTESARNSTQNEDTRRKNIEADDCPLTYGFEEEICNRRVHHPDTDVIEIATIQAAACFQSVIYSFMIVLIMLLIYWVTKYVKKKKVVRQFRQTGDSTTNLSGQMLLSYESQKLSTAFHVDTTDTIIKPNDSSLKVQLLNSHQNKKESVEQEYYRMIESANEVIATDCTAWDNDTTESESESTAYDNILKGNDVKADDLLLSVSDPSMLKSVSTSSLDSASDHGENSKVFSLHLNPVNQSIDTREILNSPCNCCQHTDILQNKSNTTHGSYMPISVDSIELAFLAGEHFRLLIHEFFICLVA